MRPGITHDVASPHLSVRGRAVVGASRRVPPRTGAMAGISVAGAAPSRRYAASGRRRPLVGATGP